MVYFTAINHYKIKGKEYIHVTIVNTSHVSYTIIIVIRVKSVVSIIWFISQIVFCQKSRDRLRLIFPDIITTEKRNPVRNLSMVDVRGMTITSSH